MPEARRVGNPNARGEVVLVRLLGQTVDIGERARHAEAPTQISGRELQSILQQTPIFVPQAKVQGEIRPNTPRILHVRRIGCAKGADHRASKNLVNLAPSAGKIVDIVAQRGKPTP